MQSKNIEYKVMHVYDSYTKQEYLVVILSRAFLRVHLVNLMQQLSHSIHTTCRPLRNLTAQLHCFLVPGVSWYWLYLRNYWFVWSFFSKKCHSLNFAMITEWKLCSVVCI